MEHSTPWNTTFCGVSAPLLRSNEPFPEYSHAVEHPANDALIRQLLFDFEGGLKRRKKERIPLYSIKHCYSWVSDDWIPTCLIYIIWFVWWLIWTSHTNTWYEKSGCDYIYSKEPWWNDDVGICAAQQQLNRQQQQQQGLAAQRMQMQQQPNQQQLRQMLINQQVGYVWHGCCTLANSSTCS